MRRLIALALATASMVLMGASAASAAEAEDPGLGEKLRDCVGVNGPKVFSCAIGAGSDAAGDALEGTPLAGLSDITDKFAEVVDTLQSLTPQGIVETWAQGVGEFAIKTVSWISERAVDITAPQFDDEGWLKQYSIAAGLGLVIFAFVLAMVAAKVAKSSGDRVDHAQLLRDAGLSVWVVPVAIVSAPALLVTLGGAIADVGAVFSTQVREGEAAQRMQGLVEPLVDEAGKWAPLGGAFGAIVIFLIVAILGVYVLLTLYFVSEAQLLFALFLPVVLGLWAYAPWRSMARRIIAGLVALLLMPTVLQFVFWAVWTRVGTADVSGVDAALRLVVGLALLASVPTLTMMFLPKMMPDGSSAPSVGASIGGGVIGGSLTQRMLTMQSKRDGTSRNRPIATASPSQTPPGRGRSSAPTAGAGGPGGAGKSPLTGPTPTTGGGQGAATKGAGSASVGSGSAAGGGAAAGVGATTGAGSGAGAAGGAGAGAAGGPMVATAAAAAMGAKALKQAGQSASTAGMGVADAGGDGGGQRPTDR